MIGRQASAHEFADMIVDEFAELAATPHPLVMSIVLHSFISGVPFRLRAVRGALERIAAADGVWLDNTARNPRGRAGFAEAVPADRGGGAVTEPVAHVDDYSLALVRNGIRSQVLTGVDLQIRAG